MFWIKIDVTKKVKDLLLKVHKTLLRETSKVLQRNGKFFFAEGSFLWINLWIQCTPIKITAGFFAEIDKLIQKLISPKSTLKNKNKDSKYQDLLWNCNNQAGVKLAQGSADQGATQGPETGLAAKRAEFFVFSINGAEFLPVKKFTGIWCLQASGLLQKLDVFTTH